MWKSASSEVQKYFYDLANEEAAAHRAMYPNYRYGGGVRKAYPAAGHKVSSNMRYIGEHLVAHGF